MLDRLRRLLPHAAILICNMYIVFFLIDRVNKAMNFIDNGLTKGLLAALCLIGLWNGRTLEIVTARRSGSKARRTGVNSQSIRRRGGEKRRGSSRGAV